MTRSLVIVFCLIVVAACTPLRVDIAVTADGDVNATASSSPGESKTQPKNPGKKPTESAPSGEPSKPKGPSQYEVFGKVYTIMDSNIGYFEIGIASWYGRKFHGRLTAMGEVYDMYELTAAHKSLPLPTVVKVTNLDNARSIVVRVNDRGPFHDDRVIDLSYAAARALGFDHKGTAPIVVEALDEINHPELKVAASGESYYLQAGAFKQKRGASRQLAEVQRALTTDVPARILISELDNGQLIYKVWVGPFTDIEEELFVETRLIDRNLGRPIRVTVE